MQSLSRAHSPWVQAQRFVPSASKQIARQFAPHPICATLQSPSVVHDGDVESKYGAELPLAR